MYVYKKVFSNNKKICLHLWRWKLENIYITNYFRKNISSFIQIYF